MGKNFESLGYRKKGNETRFETLLRYSDEKEKSARVLGEILKEILRENVDFLDLGSGNGEFLLRSLQHSRFRKPVRFILLEPSKDLLIRLKATIKKFPKNSKIKIISQRWEDYDSEKKFDIVLVSHSTYGWHRKNWEKLFTKMVDCLRPGGSLVFITRLKDDAYAFKQLFRPFFFGKTFKAVELGECLRVFAGIFAKKRMAFRPRIYKSHSTLQLPIKKNFEDAVSLIEFYLVKSWSEMPKEVQEKILKFLRSKRYILRQVDGIAVVRKTLL